GRRMSALPRVRLNGRRAAAVAADKDIYFPGACHCLLQASDFCLSFLADSSIVAGASFYLAFTDQWFNPSPPPYFHSSILGLDV
uniref:Uncharacterized protein n=1 Tax=Aegilops tauschii subsp. strangulata TaxID=200361 RepID=A0A453HN33_AEGTS